MVFNVGLEHFFGDGDDEPAVAIVRKAERIRLPDEPGKEPASYYFESLDYPVTENRVMDAFYAEFEQRAGPSAPHRHEGPELIYVLKGELAVDVDGREHVLRAGDAMTFDARFAHSYQARGRAICAALVVLASWPRG